MAERLLALLLAGVLFFAGLALMASLSLREGVMLVWVGAMLAVWVWADLRRRRGQGEA